MSLGLNEVQKLAIGQARHNLQHQEQWSDVKARQTDRLLANMASVFSLTDAGLSAGQVERLLELEVADLAALLKTVL